MRHYLTYFPLLLLPLCWAMLGACGSDDKTKSEVTSNSESRAGLIVIPEGLSSSEQDAAELARSVFIRTCGISGDEWQLFSDAKLEVRSATGYRKHDLDWDTAVWITLVYKDGLQPGISGHHLPFYVGAGSRPGIVTSKPQAIEFCQFVGRAQGVRSGSPCKKDGSEDCILDLDELKQIDANRAPSIQAHEGLASVEAYCFGHGFDPPEFWTCTLSKRECQAAWKVQKREENDEYQVRTPCSASGQTHCFIMEGDSRTVCAPDAERCVRSRKQWTDLREAGPCQVATKEMIAAALTADE